MYATDVEGVTVEVDDAVRKSTHGDLLVCYPSREGFVIFSPSDNQSLLVNTNKAQNS